MAGLYEKLYRGRFLALVADPALELTFMMFLTYPTPDGVRDFTGGSSQLLAQLVTDASAATIELDGASLWRRMLDIAQTGECEVAIDPGEQHGIRLTREMIVGC